jgi:peptidyl-prolyl cis-trans isomerase B (cyclophilin B)
MSHKQWDTPPEMEIDASIIYKIAMDTNKGLIEIELYLEHAPITVNNFVFLAKQGYYDDVAFHRVINNFVIQGGDPTGTGSGGPSYNFKDECDGNPLIHERGILSMANSGPNTNGSQFFITHSPQPHLNGKHTVFGKVISGLFVVDEIKEGDGMITVKVVED